MISFGLHVISPTEPISIRLSRVVRAARSGVPFAARAFVLLVVVAGLASAQNPIPDPNFESGTKLFGSYHGGNIDNVNLLTGGVTLDIPLISYPQRGKLKLDFALHYNSTMWYGDQVCPLGPPCTYSGPNVLVQGFNIIQAGIPVHSSLSGGLVALVGTGPSCPGMISPIQSSFMDCSATIAMSDGSSHQLWATGPTTYVAVDGSGYRMDSTATGGSLVVTDVEGTRYPLSSGSILAEDTNGNQILEAVNTTNGSITLTDTVGRIIPPMVSTTDYTGCTGPLAISSASLWNLPGVNGGTYTLKFCYVQVAESLPGPPVVGSQNYNATLLQSVVRPDSTAWTFNYTSDGFGDLSQITFPTGGTLSYVWGSPSPIDPGTHTIILTRAVQTRTLNPNDGISPAGSWHYSYTRNISTSTPSTAIAVVTDPAQNDTVHTFTDLGYFVYYETLHQLYLGSSTNGTMLKSLKTDYTFTSLYNDSLLNQIYPAQNVMPIRVTTTLPNGLQNKVEYSYDSGPTVFLARYTINNTNPVTYTYSGAIDSHTGTYARRISEREYDFASGAPGALLRTNSIGYQALNSTSYLAANLLDLVASQQITDGNGNQVAYTSYGYDQSGLQASNVTTQLGAAPNSVRGNLTTVSHWLNTSSNPVVTHTNWYDTGEVYQTTDALGNTTTHSYDPVYAGAYFTKTCNALSQCVSATYDFNSGLLTSFTDQNASSQASGNTPGDVHNTWNYTYDSMFRMATAVGPLDNSLNHPETDFFYPNATTVQRCKKQNSNGGSACSSNGWIVDYAYFDGVGRTKQTRLADPEGDDFVDTTFDALGRVSTVSNPHRSSSLPTDGTTTTQYDALGRAIKTTKQDGSVVTTQYDLTSANSANGDCTITTDEAGKQRKACVDGLGRLIEVDEPGPGANSGGTPGSGSITISGSLSSSTTSGTKATGWFTVSGTDTFVYACQVNPQLQCNRNPALNSKIWDTGTVSVTINGVTGSASYSQNSTDAGLASTIASGLSPVTYTSNGAGTINVTANVPGPNYSMSGTSSTGDPTDFSGASFSVQVSGSTLTGGVYPVTTYDSGTLTVTVNGFQASASYGQNQNSTAAAMAQALTNALNASGSPVTASLSGTTITLTSKAVGANYTVTGSSTASFTASSTTLGGGTNPGGIDAPYVTLYSYDVLGNLLSVNQKGDGSQAARVRSFTYDSLSRLLTAYNPESGTISYSYDGNGNVLRKISPAPNQTGTATQTISYCYDQLTRITGKAYSAQTCSNGQLPAGTASASYIYDIPAPFGWQLENYIGRLVEENSYDSSGTLRSQNLYDYDSLGRVFVMEQGCGGGDCSDPPSSLAVYTYDLAGEVSSLHTYEGSIYDITYNYTYDTAGRATGMTSSLSDAQHPGTLASGLTYYPTGAIRQMTYGNGLTGTNVYNQRLQPCRGNLNFSGTGLQNCGDAIPAADVQDISYGFNFGSGDNGNVASMTAVGQQSFNRSYSYDNLNRLAGQNSPGDTCTGLTWSYDAWGNRLSQSGTGGTCNTMATTALTNNQISGYAYDAAGNMTGDGLHTYTYDAENRIISVDGGVTARFVYDAQGRRVGKIINDGGQWKNYLYGTSGEVLSESTLDRTGYGWPAAYAYFGGQLVAEYENSTTNFVHHDHLGSTRLMTAAGPSTRIQSSGGSNSWKYYYTGVCPGTSGVVYTVSVWIKNQGTTSMKISGNIVDGPVIAPGTTQLVSITETGNGTSCIQLGIATVNVGDGMDVLAFAPAMSASGGSNMIPAANQNFSGWVAYQGATVTVTQGQTPMVVDSMDYLPYGEQIAGSWGSTHKFTGKERDAETGLDYFGARYYGNWIGRFSSPDEPLIDQDLENPQSLNLYTYALNNPVRFGDADGRTVTVCINLEYGGQLCSIISDDTYARAQRAQADQKSGINAPKPGQFGDITCGGTVCGHVYKGCLPCRQDAIIPLGLGPGELLLFGPGRSLFGSMARGTAEEAMEMSAKMAAVRTAGKVGETAAGIVKNTRHILSETGTAAFRVPDILNDATKVIGEVKNVPGKLSLTNQIKDCVAWAQKNGYSFELHVPQSTTFTQPLQNLIDSGTVTVVRF